MIVFIATDYTSHLLKDSGILLKTYVKWHCEIENFVKEEYSNLSSMNLDAIIIDPDSVKDPEKISLFIQAFGNIKIILICDEIPKAIEELKYCSVVKNDMNLKDNVLRILYPEKYYHKDKKKVKIGILSKQQNYNSIMLGLNLLQCFLNYTSDICFVEVGEEAYLERLQKKLHLKRSENYFTYQNIPLLFNVGKENVKITIFVFSSEKYRNMFDKCDYAFTCTDNGFLYRNEKYLVKIKRPFKENHSRVYYDIFGNRLGFIIKKPKKFKKKLSYNTRKDLSKNQNTENKLTIREVKEKIEKKKLYQNNHKVFMVFISILIFILLLSFIVFSKTWSKNIEMAKETEITSQMIPETTIQEAKSDTENLVTTTKKIKKKVESKTQEILPATESQIKTRERLPSQRNNISETTKIVIKKKTKQGKKTKKQIKKPTTKMVEKITSEKLEETTSQVATTQIFDFNYDVN